MKKRPVLVHVTDHAILRWLEREHGIDINTVRAHLEGKVMTGAEYGAIAVQTTRTKLVLMENGVAPDGEALVAVVTAMAKTAVPHV